VSPQQTKEWPSSAPARADTVPIARTSVPASEAATQPVMHHNPHSDIAAAVTERKREISAEMARVRARTLRLVSEVPEALWSRRVHDFYSPIGWHFGHIGMTEEFWTCGRALRLAALDDRLCFLFANIPENPKDNRVHLPSRPAIVAYLAATRERALAGLDSAALDSDDPLLADGYAWEFAIQHECQHQETIAELLQLVQQYAFGQDSLFARSESLSAPSVQPRGNLDIVSGGQGAGGPEAKEFIPSLPAPPSVAPSLSTPSSSDDFVAGAPGSAPSEAHTARFAALLPAPSAGRQELIKIPAGAFMMGSDERHGYDNEKRAHVVEVATFELAREPVTAGEWIAFIEDGGYELPAHWSSEGWAWRNLCDVCLPEYWLRTCDGYACFGAEGLRDVDQDEPVSSLSWYEADAYARWAGQRLPTEIEWEYAATLGEAGDRQRFPWGDSPDGAELADCELRCWRPKAVNRLPPAGPAGLRGMAGGVWEWTASPFLPYPGFEAFPYDGYSKEHMDGRHYACRGGSWATDRRILRASFRNWYVPTYRQGFLGVRCAR